MDFTCSHHCSNLHFLFQSTRNLSQLPNFAMSVPLAMFHHSQQEGLDTWPADLMVCSLLINLITLQTCHVLWALIEEE